MREQLENYFIVPENLTMISGIQLVTNTFLWIPGKITLNESPTHLYGLPHAWDTLDPEEEMQVMNPTKEDWLQIHLFIADGLLVRTTREGKRL